MFNNGVLKDCRLIYACECRNFYGNADTTVLNNSKSSQSLHVSMFRSHYSIPGKGNYKKLDNSGRFMGDPPFDNFGNIDFFYCERKQFHYKSIRFF